jgi:hypothetical protein
MISQVRLNQGHEQATETEHRRAVNQWDGDTLYNANRRT